MGGPSGRFLVEHVMGKKRRSFLEELAEVPPPAAPAPWMHHIAPRRAAEG